jgi:hypothetical protein
MLIPILVYIFDAYHCSKKILMNHVKYYCVFIASFTCSISMSEGVVWLGTDDGYCTEVPVDQFELQIF